MNHDTQFDGYIQQRQIGVLERAIRTLRAAANHELAGEVHRLRGTLGTFGLTDADECLAPLAKTLALDADSAELATERASAVSALESLLLRMRG